MILIKVIRKVKWSSTTTNFYQKSCSKFVDEFVSCDVYFIIDAKDFVDLSHFTFDLSRMIGILELGGQLGARIWDILDEDNLIVVDVSFHEVEIVN